MPFNRFTIRNIDNVNSIYICFGKYIDAFNLLQSDIQSLFPLQQQPWVLGDDCLVILSLDGTNEYVRCKILNFHVENLCYVYLRDIGKIIEVATNNLKPSNEKFRNLRDFVWKISLTGIDCNGHHFQTVNDKIYAAANSFDAMAVSLVENKTRSKDAYAAILWSIRKSESQRLEYININAELGRWNMTNISLEELNKFVNSSM